MKFTEVSPTPPADIQAFVRNHPYYVGYGSNFPADRYIVGPKFRSGHSAAIYGATKADAFYEAYLNIVQEELLDKRSHPGLNVTYEDFGATTVVTLDGETRLWVCTFATNLNKQTQKDNLCIAVGNIFAAAAAEAKIVKEVTARLAH